MTCKLGVSLFLLQALKKDRQDSEGTSRATEEPLQNTTFAVHFLNHVQEKCPQYPPVHLKSVQGAANPAKARREKKPKYGDKRFYFIGVVMSLAEIEEKLFSQNKRNK